MRREIRTFAETAADCFDLAGPIFEFGSYQVEGQQHIGDLRPLFPRKQYVGCDLRSGPGVDRIENVSDLSLADESVSTILCLETLEHVFRVQDALSEMIRVLAPGGTLVISVPFYFHIHAHPGDFWRITPQCLAGLLEPLDARMVGYQGTATTPHSVYAIAAKQPVADDFARRCGQFAEAFQHRLSELERTRNSSARWQNWLRQWLLSKGERRRRRLYFQCHFDPCVVTAAATQALVAV